MPSLSASEGTKGVGRTASKSSLAQGFNGPSRPHSDGSSVSSKASRVGKWRHKVPIQTSARPAISRSEASSPYSTTAPERSTGTVGRSLIDICVRCWLRLRAGSSSSKARLMSLWAAAPPVSSNREWCSSDSHCASGNRERIDSPFHFCGRCHNIPTASHNNVARLPALAPISECCDNHRRGMENCE